MYVISSSLLEPLFKSLDFVDDVITLKGNEVWSRKNMKLVNHVHAGVGVIFRDSLRDAFFMKFTLIPLIFGVTARGNSIFLEKSFDLSKHKDLHHSLCYMGIAYSLGAPEWDGVFSEFKDLKEPEITDPELKKILDQKNLLLVAPGGAYKTTEILNINNFTQLIRTWTENFKGSCVICGTLSEKEICDKIKSDLKSKNVFTLAGKLDISDLIKLVRKAKGCVCNDNGLMHLAAAAGCPGIAIFKTSNSKLNIPMSDKWTIFQDGKNGSACFTRGCPKDSYTDYPNIAVEKLIPELQKFVGDYPKWIS